MSKRKLKERRGKKERSAAEKNIMVGSLQTGVQQPRHNIARLMPPSPSCAKGRAGGVMSAIGQRREHGTRWWPYFAQNEIDSRRRGEKKDAPRKEKCG